MGRLANKVAVVTGGAMGLGEADVRAFVDEGATVYIADVADDAGRDLAAQLGENVRFVHLDVSNEGEFAAVLDRVVEEAGGLDILVNNAGVVEPANPETVLEKDIHRIFAVSTFGTMFGCKHAIRLMQKSGGGSIINMSSVSTVQGMPYAAAYSAAKGGIEAYTRTVAVHCLQNNYNIRCNSVHPSAFATPMMAGTAVKMPGAGDASMNDRFVSRTSGAGDPVHVGRLVLFLASDESSYITGQRFVIDNGGTLVPAGME